MKGGSTFYQIFVKMLKLFSLLSSRPGNQESHELTLELARTKVNFTLGINNCLTLSMSYFVFVLGFEELRRLFLGLFLYPMG